MRMRVRIVCSVILLSAACQSHAAVVEYEQRINWTNAVDHFTTVDFTGYPENTNITTQYQSQGVTFTDGLDLILFSNGFINDGVGLNGALDSIHLAFSVEMHHIAVEFPGSMQILLLWRGQVTYTSTEIIHVGTGFFFGLVSDQPFDGAVILDPTGAVFIDDLHFGPPIAAPGALGMLAMSLCVIRDRRRCR